MHDTVTAPPHPLPARSDTLWGVDAERPLANEDSCTGRPSHHAQLVHRPPPQRSTEHRLPARSTLARTSATGRVRLTFHPTSTRAQSDTPDTPARHRHPACLSTPPIALTATTTSSGLFRAPLPTSGPRRAHER